MAGSDLLLYGSYGYTGRLVADAAVAAGLSPVLAGRDREALEAQAAESGLDARPFALDDPDAVADHLADADAVLSCAGPFVDTYEPMVEACLRTGTHYLDIAGELDVFEAIRGYDGRAADADVMVLPGVGFDVVPTDCLAAHLAERLPDATHLALGIDALGAVSPGTARTAVEYLGRGGLVRRGGRLERVPVASKARRIDFGFGGGRKTAVTVPWADLSTAYHTTGVPNIEVYLAVPVPAAWAMRGVDLVAPFLGTPPAKALLEALAGSVPGPSERRRARETSRVWGEATVGGERVVSRLRGPNAYDLTAAAAVEVARRVLDGDAPPGYRTPASAYGPDLVLAVEGTERVCSRRRNR